MPNFEFCRKRAICIKSRPIVTNSTSFNEKFCTPIRIDGRRKSILWAVEMLGILLYATVVFLKRWA